MSTIDKIARLTQQNTEFDMELRKRLNVASANSVLSDDERINDIYEYCIEDIIKKQATEFYADFPLQTIKDHFLPCTQEINKEQLISILNGIDEEKK